MDPELTVSDRIICSNRSLVITETSMVTGLPIWPVVMGSMFDITHRSLIAHGCLLMMDVNGISARC